MKITLQLMLLMLLFQMHATAAKTFTLEEVKHHEDFEVLAKATGKYGKGSVNLTITSKYRKSVKIIIPEGTEFFTDDEDHQILMLAKEKTLKVNKGKSKTVVLDAFCTEHSDRVPSNDFTMHFESTKRDQLKELASYLDKHNSLNDHLRQEAIWCVSDGNPVSYIYDEGTKSEQKLAEFVAELTGQEKSWNHVRRQHSVVNGQIETTPIFVTGEIEFSTSRQITLGSKIVDASGNTVYENPKTRPFPKTDKAGLSFNLTVRGWDKGKYAVVYFDQDHNIILRKEFEI